MGIWTAIKHAMNSTLGTSEFSPLDKIIKNGLSDVDTNVIRLRGGVQTFTANGTFTVPSGVTKIWVTACAGGQGGTERQNDGREGGDGGDWIVRHPYAVTAGQKIAITVGKGGAVPSVVGGSTVIGTLVTLSCPGIRGGKGGSYSYADGERGEDGKDGYAPGGKGCVVGTGYRGGGGGGGSLGRGGDVGEAGQLGGGGGGNEFRSAGGKGGDGIVIIEW